MAPHRNDFDDQSSSDSEAASPALETSARSSSASLKALKRELREQLSQRNISLTPTLPSDLAFTRNQIRNAYLRLLFHAPFTKSAHQAELALWNDTTLKIVGIYRERLHSLEKETKDQKQSQSTSSRPATPSKDASKPDSAQAAVRPIAKRKSHAQEHGKMAEALRQFLAKEEAFWKGLAERMAAVFGLTETQAALERAGITMDGRKIPIGPKAIVGEGGQPAGLARLPNSSAELDPTVLQMASLPRHRERLVEIVHRSLVYCGDLARYREVYRENSNSSPSRNASGLRGGFRKPPTTPVATNPQHRNFDDAIACYEAARLLMPSSGNPSNQLAVIAGYTSDTFGAVYHYHRALCVRIPFESAKTNLATALRKSVADWEKDGGLEALQDTNNEGPRRLPDDRRRQACLKEFVVLQGLFYTRQHFTSMQTLSARFHRTFQASVADKLFSTDTIVRILITSIAASWTTRLWRRSDANGSFKKKQSSEVHTEEVRAADDERLTLNIELQLLDHVLAISQALFDVATSQTRFALNKTTLSPIGPAQKAGERDAPAQAARNLTPVMRRVLPAMRIASKWVKSHLDYIDRSQQSCISKAAEGFSALKSDSNNAEAVACAAAELALIQKVEDFWASFVEFTNTLRYAFPFDSLPSLGTVRPTGSASLGLEEDTDLRGFIPTRRGMLTQDDTPVKPADRELHPNDEQLLRIADLLVDAKVIAESEASPITFDDGKGTFVVDPSAKLGHGKMQQIPSHANDNSQASTKPRSSSPGDGDESASVGNSEATEDIVDLAMRVRDRCADLDDEDGEGSDDEDEILIPAVVQSRRLEPEKVAPGYESGSRTPNPLAGLEQALPPETGISHYNRFETGPPPGASQPSPIETSREGVNTALPSGSGPTTAQDLLLQMLNGRAAHSNSNPGSSGFATPPSRELSNGPLPVSRTGSGHGSPSYHHRHASTPQSHLLFGGLGTGVTRQIDPPPHHSSLAGLASIWSPSPGEMRQQPPSSGHIQNSPRAPAAEGIWSTGSGTGTPTAFASPSLMQQQFLRNNQQWQPSPSQQVGSVGDRSADLWSSKPSG